MKDCFGIESHPMGEGTTSYRLLLYTLEYSGSLSHSAYLTDKYIVAGRGLFLGYNCERKRLLRLMVELSYNSDFSLLQIILNVKELNKR